MEKPDVKDAINEFFKLKHQFEVETNKNKKKIINNKELSKKEKRAEYLKLMPKCINCKKPSKTGTDFTITYHPASDEKESFPSRVVLDEIKRIAYTAHDELCSGNLDAIGELLHESWLLKKRLASGVSNHNIDEMYTTARNAGALGGKVTGAGGGGFLILYCPHSKQANVRKALSGLKELPFLLENDGSKVIFNRKRS